MATRILFADISGCFVFLSHRSLYALPCVNIFVFKVVIPCSVNANNWCQIGLDFSSNTVVYQSRYYSSYFLYSYCTYLPSEL